MKSTSSIPLGTNFYVDPSPHYPDDYPVKDSWYHRVIKAGDKIRAWCAGGQAMRKFIRTNFIEGVVEEIDGILWVRVLRYYKSDREYDEKIPEGPYKLINNFINRCYTVVIIDANNEEELRPIKKIKKED